MSDDDKNARLATLRTALARVEKLFDEAYAERRAAMTLIQPYLETWDAMVKDMRDNHGGFGDSRYNVAGERWDNAAFASDTEDTLVLVGTEVWDANYEMDLFLPEAFMRDPEKFWNDLAAEADAAIKKREKKNAKSAKAARRRQFLKLKEEFGE